MRRLPQDYPVNDAGSPIAPLMYNAVGGSTIHWSAHFPRFRPSDFRVRSLDGVADDWPIDYATLEPFFDLNDRMMGVAGIDRRSRLSAEVAAADAADPARHARGHHGPGLRSPRLALVAVGQRHPHARLRRPPRLHQLRPLRPRLPDRGEGEHRHHLLAQGAGVRARASQTHARVREITLGPDGRADGALYHDREGRLREQKARAVVLAANGIGTPRLLLNSRSARFPDGLANRSGLVGRNLMFHPYALVRGVFDRPLGGHRGPIGCSIISQEFYETDLSRGFVRGYSFQVARGLSPIASALGGSIGGPRALGSRAPSRLRRRLRPHDHRRDHRRGPARAGEPCRPRSRAHRRPRHPGAARVLHAQREQPAHARPWHRPRGRGAGSGRRPRGSPPIPSCGPGAGT